MTYDLVRGMYDILPDEIPWWQLAENAVREMKSLMVAATR